MQKRVPKGVKMALNGEGVTSEDRTSMKLYSKTWTACKKRSDVQHLDLERNIKSTIPMNSNKFSYEHIFFAGKFYSFFATRGVLGSGFFEGLPLYTDTVFINDS